MAEVSCPAILISAPSSGQGKTITTAALARAWINKGLNVRAFKCGPDFIDSKILEMATRQPVFNLDLGMCGIQDANRLLFNAAKVADLIIVEGVMGLYDGSPSTADIAEKFKIPVALTIDASGMAQTFGALTHGLLNFNPSLNAYGVIANKVGSEGHAKLLKSALKSHVNWLGCLKRNTFFELPSRHLGLHLASEVDNLDAKLDDAAKELAQSAQLILPPQVTLTSDIPAEIEPLLKGKTIAIARDDAFCFIYPANVECLESMGAELIFFSLLDDNHLPDADAYWLPGGYPELHLEKINNNHQMKASLKEAKASSKPILAECGGMMALSESINGKTTYGLMSGSCVIESTFQGLGTQSVSINGEWINGHTFHYGSFNTNLDPVYIASSKFGSGEPIYKDESIIASFIHFYFPSNPKLTAQLFS